MAVTIGQMNRLAILQRKTITADESGQPQETWEDVSRWRCAVQPLSTKEAFAARQAEVIVTQKVTGWYMREVHRNAPLMRLMLNERILNIVSISVVMHGRARQMELLCGEVQPWANQTKATGPALE